MIGQRTLRCPAPWLLAVPISIALSWTVVCPTPASSQEIPDEDLLALSLEELLNVKVGVASLEDELIIETPAVVSYLDPQVLRRMGLTKLEDWISFSPGFVFQAGSAGQPTQMILIAARMSAQRGAALTRACWRFPASKPSSQRRSMSTAWWREWLISSDELWERRTTSWSQVKRGCGVVRSIPCSSKT